MILGLQITAFIFSVVMIYFAVLNFRRGELSGVEFFSWLIIWIFTLFVVVFPDPLQGFAKSFEFARLFDMMVVGGIMVLLVMVSTAYLRTRKMEKKLEELVRKIALKDGKTKK